MEEGRESLMPADMGQRVVFERETTSAINRARARNAEPPHEIAENGPELIRRHDVHLRAIKARAAARNAQAH